MTKLVDEILTAALKGTDSWKLAEDVAVFASSSDVMIAPRARDQLKYPPAA